MKKIILLLLILVVVGGSVFAFDISTFPSPIQPGNLLISPTISIGRFFSWWDYGFLLGITGAVEYALPIPLTVGGEVGVAFGFGEYGVIGIPILAKVAWHPNFEVPNLYTYITLKLGASLGFPTGEAKNDTKGGAGFAYGFNAGVRYFFTPTIGVFGELGWDQYRYSIKYDGGYYYGSWKYKGWMGSFFHAGITFKI